MASQQQSMDLHFLQRLITLAAATPGVEAAYLVGAAAAGHKERYPERHLYLVIPSPLPGVLSGWATQAGESVGCLDAGQEVRLVTPQGLLIFLHSVQSRAQLPQSGLQPLFSRGEEQPPESGARSGPDLTQTVTGFWMDLFQAAGAIGRSESLAAHGHLERCRVGLIDLYRLALDPAQVGSGWEGGDRLPDRRLTEGLRLWLVAPLELWAQWRCAHRLAAAYESLIMPLVERTGLEYPWSLRRLLFERLEEIRPQERAADHPGGGGVTAPADRPPEDPPASGTGATPARYRIKGRRPS